MTDLMRSLFRSATLALWPAVALAEEVARGASESARDGGASAVWVFANISYAGMRAQASPSWGWRMLAFIFGFPGTLLSFFAVEDGAGRMYGIQLPRRSL